MHGQLGLAFFPATNFSGTFSTCLRDLMCMAGFWSVPGLRVMGQDILNVHSDTR
jgi:hypothetical protein